MFISIVATFLTPLAARSHPYLLIALRAIIGLAHVSSFIGMLGEETGKGQLQGNDFCQFYRDFQGHEVELVLWVGLGMELGTKSRCL